MKKRRRSRTNKQHDAIIAAVVRKFYKTLADYPVGCKRHQDLINALQEMIKISKRNSEPELMLIAIRKCAQHALAKHE